MFNFVYGSSYLSGSGRVSGRYFGVQLYKIKRK